MFRVKKLFRLTPSGIDELNEELNGLISQRAGVADRIRSARELGDLSENAEYQTAREEQDRLEARISELEHILQNVQMISKPKNNGVVKLGSHVKLKDGTVKQFQVVGTMEADPLNGKVSDESPIGKALLGKKVSDKVELKTSSETTTYKIIEIA
jgi:transcription elongation factor GreA